MRAWTGPAAAHQDFQLPRAAIEVKTSAGKEPQTLVISSERELDDTAARPSCCWPTSHWMSGAAAAARASTRSSTAPAPRWPTPPPGACWTTCWCAPGTCSQQRDLYDEPRYTVRRQRFWHVTGDFPRITEADLRPGVGDCRYRISTSGTGRVPA